MKKTIAEAYDTITAYHYAAYRPLLHLPILRAVLQQEDTFPSGLDVGCGTGQSAVALTHFCQKIHGIEPSMDMLQKAIRHPKIEYSHYNAKEFHFPDDTFDILTFAGSLFYAKSQTLLDEVVRVSKPKSKIVVYDFDIPLTEILEKLRLGHSIKRQIAYDHKIGFEGLKMKNILLEKTVKNQVSITMAIPELAHILLSSKDDYALFSKHFGKDNLYTKVSQKLHAILKGENTELNALCYSKSYRNIK